MARRAVVRSLGVPQDAVREARVRLLRGVQRQLEAEVEAHLGGAPAALERYFRAYLADLRRNHRASTYGELYRALLGSDLVLVGDYHTLRQAQETAHRLLERAVRDPRPVRLGLEMVLQEHQPQLDAYMHGALRDEEFLASIRYRETWDFRWRNYRPLLATARAHGVPVAALNVTGSNVRARDARIARRIVKLVAERPEMRTLVLVGDMHLAAAHLPAALDRAVEDAGVRAPRRLIVYQNSDELYWDLAAQGAEVETQVVRMGDDRFCIQEVPPWVKLQSFLGWEKEREAFEDAWDSEGPEATCTAVLEHLVGELARFLGLPTPELDCDVFVNLDEGFLDAVAGADLGEDRQREIHLHAFSNRSCFVPELELVYLPYLSVHHAAEEAMHVLLWRAGRFDPAAAEGYEGFYARALWAGLGYAASKIVNAHRRGVDEATLRGFLNAASRELRDPELAFRKLVARFVLQHKEHERARRAGGRGRLKQVYEQEPEVTLEVVQALGTLLGEAIAQGLRDGAIGPEALREVVLEARPDNASRTYFQLIDRLGA